MFESKPQRLQGQQMFRQHEVPWDANYGKIRQTYRTATMLLYTTGDNIELSKIWRRMWDVPHNLLLGYQNKKVKTTIQMCQDIDKHNAIKDVHGWLCKQRKRTRIKCKAGSYVGIVVNCLSTKRRKGSCIRILSECADTALKPTTEIVARQVGVRDINYHP